MLIINSKASDKQNYKDLMGTGRLVLAPLPAGTSFRTRFLSTSNYRACCRSKLTPLKTNILQRYRKNWPRPKKKQKNGKKNVCRNLACCCSVLCFYCFVQRHWDGWITIPSSMGKSRDTHTCFATKLMRRNSIA